MSSSLAAMASLNNENKQLLTLLTLDSDPAIRNLMVTTIKINNTNYLSWAQSFKLFISAQQKTQHLTKNPLNFKDPICDDWLASD